MENKLEQLTQKLYEEGLVKGRSEGDRVVAEAEAKAKKIVKDAEAEAAEIVRRANKESEDIRKNAMTEISLAGRHALARIKEELKSAVIRQSVSGHVHNANLDAGFVKEMLLAVAANWNGAQAGKITLDALLPADMKESFDKKFAASVNELLAAGIEVGYSDVVRTGFKIGAKGGGYYISFTDDDFNTLIKEYLRHKVSELLFESQD